MEVSLRFIISGVSNSTSMRLISFMSASNRNRVASSGSAIPIRGTSISPDELRPIDNIAQAGCAVFLMCGTQDRHTTTDETEAMYSSASSPKELWLVSGAAHEDLYQAATKRDQSKVLSCRSSRLDNNINLQKNSPASQGRRKATALLVKLLVSQPVR